jgi:hypothetical protein
VLRRFGIRMGVSLVAIAAGLLVCSALLSGFSIGVASLIEATLLFWIIHLIVQFLALRILIRQPSVAMAGLLALGSTVVALILVNIIVSGFSVGKAVNYVLATLIIWLAIAGGDVFARRTIREQRGR